MIMGIVINMVFVIREVGGEEEQQQEEKQKEQEEQEEHEQDRKAEREAAGVGATQAAGGRGAARAAEAGAGSSTSVIIIVVTQEILLLTLGHLTFDRLLTREEYFLTFLHFKYVLFSFLNLSFLTFTNHCRLCSR